MSKKLIIPSKIVTLDPDNRILKNHAVEVSGNKISSINEIDEKVIHNFDGEVIRAEGLILIPGFVQTHLHLCQTLFRGLADDLQLLDWLQLKIFPFENAHNKDSLKASVRLGINELILSGTTTILDMGSLRNQDVIFDELISSGIRALAGNCLIDQNDLFDTFKSNTEDELKKSLELAECYHNKANGRIKYAFTPRFVLTCSEELLKESKEMMKDFEGSIYHSHSSENKEEVAEVRRRFNKENLEYFNSINILDERTVLAHCIHVNEKEIGLLKHSQTRVAHCPSSNLKLASGIADIPRYLQEGISVSLGADGAACNNSLSIFNEMRTASLIQKPSYGATAMNSETVFRLATIEGAKALHLEKEIGSIEPGKKADLVLLDLNKPLNSYKNNSEEIFSQIVYTSTHNNVNDVMIDGEWVVRNGESLLYDQKELYKKGSEELEKLLKRV